MVPFSNEHFPRKIYRGFNCKLQLSGKHKSTHQHIVTVAFCTKIKTKTDLQP